MSNKLMIIVLALVVLIMLAMGGGFFMMWNKMATLGAPPPTEEELAEEEAEEEGPETIGPMYSLQPFIVNLAEDGGTRYLRVTLDMELGSEEVNAEVDQRLPQIRNTLLMILPSKKMADINTSEGKAGLRDEIIDSVNELLATGEIANIYFTEFVIQ